MTEPGGDADLRRAELEREIDVLEAVRHPGVVEVLGVDDGPGGPALRTAPIDGVPLSRLGSLTVEEAAGTVAAVASTLADLHDLGIVHGHLTADHVLVQGDGRPVLSGFGAAAAAPSAVDPGASAPDASHDVRALGILLRDLTDAPSVPAKALRPRRGRRDVHVVEALRDVAERATAADPHLRPSARALADAVRHAVPEARLARRRPAIDAPPDEWSEPPAAGTGRDRSPVPDRLLALRRPTSEPHRTTDRRRAADRPSPRPGVQRASARERRRPLLLGAAALAVAGLTGAIALSATSTTSTRSAPGSTPGGSADSRFVPPPTSPAATRAPATTVARSRPAASVPPGPTCSPVVTALAADTDGDGCPEAMRWADGVLQAGDSRWAVGRPDDRVATGDWACAGTSTLALLRPSTGEVFVFDEWAAAGVDLTASARTVVAGGFALRAGDLDGDGCTDLLVDRPGGVPVAVAVQPEQP